VKTGQDLWLFNETLLIPTLSIGHVDLQPNETADIRMFVPAWIIHTTVLGGIIVLAALIALRVL
jgi:hypothetical protein